MGSRSFGGSIARAQHRVLKQALAVLFEFRELAWAAVVTETATEKGSVRTDPIPFSMASQALDVTPKLPYLAIQLARSQTALDASKPALMRWVEHSSAAPMYELPLGAAFGSEHLLSRMNWSVMFALRRSFPSSIARIVARGALLSPILSAKRSAIFISNRRQSAASASHVESFGAGAEGGAGV